MLRLEKTDEAARFLLVLQQGNESEEIYNCEVSACGSPYCNCSTVTLMLSPGSDSARRIWPERGQIDIHLDPFDRCHDDEATDGSDARLVALGRRIASEMPGEQWDLFEMLFRVRKAAALRDLDPEREPCPFPFDEIESTSVTVAFQEVFPFAETFEAEEPNGFFIVDDQYCVREQCECTDVLLDFIGEGRERGRTPPRHRPLILDYREQRWTEQRTGRPLTGESERLRQALLAARPGLLAEIEGRHSLLRRLYRASKDRLDQPGQVVDPVRADRPGRNEPCPCGSGRKFKRCCGA